MSSEKIVFAELSYKIIGIAMAVHRELGPGFLEKVYENAMIVAFRQERIFAEQQVAVKVYFRGEEVGHYLVDILVDEKIILELKAGEGIVDAHRAQTLNYLTATQYKLAIILNFGKKSLQYERLANTKNKELAAN